MLEIPHNNKNKEVATEAYREEVLRLITDEGGSVGVAFRDLDNELEKYGRLPTLELINDLIREKEIVALIEDEHAPGTLYVHFGTLHPEDAKTVRLCRKDMLSHQHAKVLEHHERMQNTLKQFEK